MTLVIILISSKFFEPPTDGCKKTLRWHARAPQAVFDFELTATEMARIDSLERGGEDQHTMVGWLREFDPDHY